MKLTRILPRPFAKAYQEWDLNKAENMLDYHRAYVAVLEQHVAEARAELDRLEEGR